MISVHSQDGNIGTYNTATGDLQVKTEYDTHDRTVSVTLADASTTRSAYTGRETRYEYDQLGRKLMVSHPDAGETDMSNDSTNATREMYWGEDNRLMILSDNGKTSRYTYNAAGERIMKSYGTMEGVYINGAPQGITFHETDNFTLYPASILSVNKNRFTKHYFIGTNESLQGQVRVCSTTSMDVTAHT